MVMKNIKAGDVVEVIAPWTKGQTLSYLITFADEGSSFMSGIRILRYNNAAETGTQITEIDAKSYANVFTGFHALALGDIKDVITTVSQETYNRITSAVFSVMNGEYNRTASGFYRVDKKEFNYADVFLALNRVNAVNSIKSEQQDDPIVDTADVRSEEEIANEAENTNQSRNTRNKSNKKEKAVRNESDTKKKETKEDENKYEDIIKIFNGLTSENQRIDYIFNIFGENGRISPNRVYNILFRNGQNLYRIRKNSIVVTKSEFLLLTSMTTRTVPSDLKFTHYDMSTYDNVNKGTIYQLITTCKALYRGSVVNIGRNKYTEEEINEILEDYLKDMNTSRIVTKYKISYSVFLKWKKIYLGKDNNDKAKTYPNTDVETILSGITSPVNLTKCSEKEKQELIAASNYLLNNKSLIIPIANGYVCNEYKGNKDILTACAVKILTGRSNCKAALMYSNLILRLPNNIIMAIFSIDRVRFSLTDKNTVRNKMFLLATVVSYKDAYDWSVYPGHISRRKEHCYQILDRCLIAIMGDIYQTDASTMLNSRGVIRDLKTYVGIPDAHLSYYFNKYGKFKNNKNGIAANQ